MRGFPDRKCHVQNISQGVAILSGKFCVRTVLVRVRHAAVPGGRQASPGHTHILQGSWCFTSSRPRSVGASRARSRVSGGLTPVIVIDPAARTHIQAVSYTHLTLPTIL